MLGRFIPTSALLLVLGGSAASGCVSSPVPPPPALPPQPAPPPPAGVEVATPAPPPSPVDPDAIDPSRIPLVLEDPRLAAVKAEVDREAYARAAAVLAGAIAAASPPAPVSDVPAAPPAPSTSLSPEDRRAWLYQLGHLRALGGDPGGAAKAFEESAATAWALSDYARVQAAQWRVGVGQFDAALADLQGLAPDHPLAPTADLTTADARLGKNDFAGASRAFRAYLARDKHPPQWVTVALRFATALLNHPKEAHAEEAIRLARRVMWESTGGQGAGAAREIEKQALATLPAKRRKALEHLSPEEMLAKARGLVASGQPREAVLVTDRLVSTKAHPPAKGAHPKPAKGKRAKAKHAAHGEGAAAHGEGPAATSGETTCEIWLVRGEALVKMRNRKPEAAEAYQGAIEHCAGHAHHPEALYLGGRASASAGRDPEAVERFARLEREHASHRLADDARLRGARAARDANDEARFAHMLEGIAEAYPEGDVTNDGLFELALSHVEKKEWARAVPVLEKALGRAPRERAYWASGRLPYFLARAQLETGATAQGLAGLAGVIRDYPLSYYMALSYARLADRDRGAAERALSEASREPEGAFALKRGPWLDEPGFVRARELLRQGDVKLARLELDRLGYASRTAPREVMWTAAFLMARQGAYTQSHSILRAPVSVARPRDNELTDWLGHYPTGKWRAAWELAYPRPFAALVAAEAPKQQLPEAWAYAIMREESAFEARVVSGAQAVGLMQLIVPTARKMGEKLGLTPDEETLKQPSVNIPLGCRYLTVLRGQFPDNPLLAIPGYNAGSGAPRKWIEKRPLEDFDLWVEHIPYEETRNYTKRVLGSMAAYEFLYFRDKPSEALHAPLAASPSARAGGATAAVQPPGAPVP